MNNQRKDEQTKLQERRERMKVGYVVIGILLQIIAVVTAYMCRGQKSRYIAFILDIVGVFLALFGINVF